MNPTKTPVKTTLRIPGNWQHPGQLLERMPDGYLLTSDRLIMPDGQQMEFTPLRPDDQFAEIFRSSCRRPATTEESEIVEGYTVNVGLTGPGGSLEAAWDMMRAGAAIVRAGGAGVFIDNSALAHGGGDWLEMAEGGGPDALSFGFVSVVCGRQKVWTIGMHVLGLPEFEIQRSRADDGARIIEVVRYACLSDHPIGDGHLLGDEFGPQFQAVASDNDRFAPGSPMYNPWGRFRLVSIRDIAESN